jgi:hypothetical protein
VPIRFVLTALVFLLGLFDLMMAAAFLFTPPAGAAMLGVAAAGAAGWSTIRADFTAFFGVAALCMMVGAWRRNGDLLLVPGLLFGVALAARALDLALTGAYPGWPQPMGVEALHVIVLAAAWRILPHHGVGELAG